FTINKLGLDTVEKSQFTLYPNPTSEAIFIDAKEVADLKVYSILGQEVIAQKLQRGKNTVQMNALPKGTYIFHFGKETKKVIKK
ncbi:T9SS type A sorting domain-containing protein, partial [Streptococcus pyogenes]